MLNFFWIAAISLFAFQMLVLHSLGKKTRIFIYSHRVVAACLNLVMSLLILGFMGVGNIVGLANLTGSTILATYIIIRGALSKEEAVIRWRRFAKIFSYPMIKIVRRQ